MFFLNVLVLFCTSSLSSIPKALNSGRSKGGYHILSRCFTKNPTKCCQRHSSDRQRLKIQCPSMLASRLARCSSSHRVYTVFVVCRVSAQAVSSWWRVRRAYPILLKDNDIAVRRGMHGVSVLVLRMPLLVERPTGLLVGWSWSMRRLPMTVQPIPSRSVNVRQAQA